MLLRIFGSNFTYRLGRSLYMQARGDLANNMSTNGELMIQRDVIKANQSSTKEKLVFFDVGANIGDWSISLLSNYEEYRPQAPQLYVFEPVPSTSHILKKRLGENKGIHYVQRALSSKDGTDEIYIAGEAAGTNSLHCENVSVAPESITIKKITATEFCATQGINNIHLFKSDTEGHDMEVILGSLPLLEEGRVAVFQFEYNHRWIFSRHYLKDVFDAIDGLPYRVGKICPDHIEVYDKWHPEHERFFEANYVLLREDAISWFSTRECNLDINNTIAVDSK